MQVLPDHPDYPQFAIWYEFARDFWDLGQAIPSIAGFANDSIAAKDFRGLPTNRSHYITDMLSNVELISLNERMHISAIGAMPTQGHIFLNFPTLSLARIVMEAGIKIAYITSVDIDIQERMARHFSVHYREMRENHRLNGLGNRWKETAQKIMDKAGSIGSSVTKKLLLADLIPLITGDHKKVEHFSNIYSVLCGPIHSSASDIFQLTHLDKKGICKILYAVSQVSLIGYESYLQYTGHQDKAYALMSVERRIRDHAKQSNL